VENVVQRTPHTNVAGLPGAGGQAGSGSRAKLVNGKDGQNASVFIYIKDPNTGSLAGPYSSAYRLEVVDFDIIDGNEDGILEFGEQITLRNIRVKNVGSSSRILI